MSDGFPEKMVVDGGGVPPVAVETAMMGARLVHSLDANLILPKPISSGLVDYALLLLLFAAFVLVFVFFFNIFSGPLVSYILVFY